MRRPARPLHQPSLKLRLVMHRPSCPPDRTEPCGAGLTCASPYRRGISGSVLIAAVRRRDRRVGFAVYRFEPGHFGAPALAGGGAEEALLPVRTARADRGLDQLLLERGPAGDQQQARPALVVEIDVEPVAAIALVADRPAVL